AVGLHPTDLVGDELGEPQVAVGPDRYTARSRIRRRRMKDLDHSLWSDAADAVDVDGEPVVAVRAADDVLGQVVRERQSKLDELAIRSNAADGAGLKVRKPRTAVGRGGDGSRPVSVTQLVLHEAPGAAQPTDTVAVLIREPDAAVETRRHAQRRTVGDRDEVEREARHPANALRSGLREPDAAVRTDR